MKTDLSETNLLGRLIDDLRHELHQYGEMLALLDHQQESVVVRAADEVLSTVMAISDQMGEVQSARRKRESCQAEVAGALEQSASATFSELTPFMPEKYRVAVEALVRENNMLLTRVQQRARQNHLLLSRSVELMQRFMNALLPAGQLATYNGDGRLAPPDQSARPLYEAVG